MKEKINNFLKYAQIKEVTVLYYHKHKIGWLWNQKFSRYDFGIAEEYRDQSWIRLYSDKDLNLAIEMAEKNGFVVINQDLINDGDC